MVLVQKILGTRNELATSIPRGSLLILDEVQTADPADISQGLRWPPGKLADAIRERCAFWNMRPYGVGDDTVGLDDSLIKVPARRGSLPYQTDKRPRLPFGRLAAHPAAPVPVRHARRPPASTLPDGAGSCSKPSQSYRAIRTGPKT